MAQRRRRFGAGIAVTDRRLPLVDLSGTTEAVRAEVRVAMERIIDAGGFIDGDDVATFEAAFAEHCGVARCVGVANGTDAVELALRALGVGAGSEVVVPVNTFNATAAAVCRTGATPVFADVTSDGLVLDPASVERVLTRRTRAVVAVHLHGQLAPVEQLRSLVALRGVALVEDAAQAHGATRFGAGPGRVGDAAAFSFYPGKNLGAFGDAGAVVTGDPDLADRIRVLGHHGRDGDGVHTTIGFNSRLDALQAVVLSAKLAHLDTWNDDRRRAALRYDRLLVDVPGVVGPVTLPGNRHVWHLYVVRVPGRDRVLRRLRRQGIEVGVHYPVPLHRQPAFAGLARGASFPVAEQAAAEILSLPLFPHITVDQQAMVVEALADVLDAEARP